MALITFSKILMGCVAALALQRMFPSLVPYPIFLEIPPVCCRLPAPSNGKLQDVIKLGEGLLDEPEDVDFDKYGVLYTVTRDGNVHRMDRNGTWDIWKNIASDSLLGITIPAAGGLIICSDKGLLKVNDEEGVQVITSRVDGEDEDMKFPNDVIEASDGTLYFSDSSTKFGFAEWALDLLETEPSGRLLKYDPSSNTTSVVVDGLAFANGVALSADQHFVVVCETWKYRCMKHWLVGHKKGETQVFIDKLPARPDNINLAPDGSFWISILEVAPLLPRFVYTLPWFKPLADACPSFFSSRVATKVENAMVVNVGSDGKMTGGFDDSEGKVMKFVSSAVEFEDNLYFGSLSNDFVGKLPLGVSSKLSYTYYQ